MPQHTPTVDAVATTIRELRKTRHMSQAALAAGCTAAEHGRTRDEWGQIIGQHGRAYMREGASGDRAPDRAPEGCARRRCAR
jgi:hypothetical protein